MSQIQEVYTTLEQIDKLLADIELKVQRLEGGAPGQASLQVTLDTFRKLESVARRYLILANRMGFKGNVAEATREATRLLVTIRQVHIAFAMLRAALSAGDPISMLAAGAALGLTAANVASYAEDSAYDNTWGT